MSNSQPSTGFVYFTNSSPKVDTSEFMSFSDTQASPNVNNFSPSCYSSPQKQQWSPKSFNNHRGRNKNNRYSNQSFCPNKSYNLSFNNSYSSPKHNNSFNKNKSKNFSKNSFLHPSFMEDPWAHLEKQLRQRHGQTNATDSFVDEQTDGECVSNSSREQVSRESFN